MGYIARMTRLLQKALETIQGLPADRQDEIARAMLSLAGRDEDSEELNPADLPAVLEGLAQFRRGDLATQAEVERAFRRFDG
jgi:hypothetical protein